MIVKQMMSIFIQKLNIIQLLLLLLLLLTLSGAVQADNEVQATPGKFISTETAIDHLIVFVIYNIPYKHASLVFSLRMSSEYVTFTQPSH